MVEITEEELAEMEEELKDIEAKDDYGAPKKPDKENLFKFFKHILDLVDTTKVGNLTMAELGMYKLPVRQIQDVAKYAEAEGLNLVSEYLNSKSHIITSTSMSKKGFWPQLFVTQIKKEQKMKESEAKPGLFSKKKEGE